LLELIEATEQRLGGYPRRRPEGVRQRIDQCNQRIAKRGHCCLSDYFTGDFAH
jgi:hypothetical protein